MRTLSLTAIVVLVVLGVLERASRADIVWRLLGTTSFGQSLTIHDVGAAAGKGIPLGGPLATGLRWSIARDASVRVYFVVTLLSSFVPITSGAVLYAVWRLDIARRHEPARSRTELREPAIIE